MPIGSYSCTADILNEITLDNKHNADILDLGIGNGYNGVSLRNYDKNYNIDGVEVWENYKNFMWEAYNNVYLKNMLDFEPSIKYDYIIITDVIEHVPMKEGKEFIDKIKNWLNPNGKIFISTPAVWIEQHTHEGNVHETHHCLWTNEDFIEHGYECRRDGSLCKYNHAMLLYVYQLS